MSESDFLVASQSEHPESADMDSHFYKVVKAERFVEVADLFKGVAKIEKTYEQRFLDLEHNVETN